MSDYEFIKQEQYLEMVSKWETIKLPSQDEYVELAKLNAQTIIEKLNEVAGLYHCGILGQLEQAGLTTAGSDMLSAISKLELLKQSL